MERQDLVGLDRLIGHILGRRTQLALRPKVLKQFQELALAVGKGFGAERGKPGFSDLSQSPGKRGNAECFENRLAGRVELQAGKAGVPIEIAAFGVLIFADIVCNAVEVSTRFGNLGFAENAEEQGKARNLLFL